MIDITALVLVLLVLCALIVLYVKVFSLETSTRKAILEIKSKIGSIIREVNRSNEIHYKVDASQQSDINRLKGFKGR